jgi:dynein heavy chain
MLDIAAKIKYPKDKAPYVVVCLQECERMNTLLGEIKRSLEDLRLGLTGALNIT